MQKTSAKISIPRELRMAIIRLQAEKDLDWPDACKEAAFLIDANREKFKRAVKREAVRIYNKRFFTEMNKARGTIEKEAARRVRVMEDNFRVPCSKCGRYIYFSSNDNNWKQIRRDLYEGFEDWHHTRCGG
jgi:hypothetical protein